MQQRTDGLRMVCQAFNVIVLDEPMAEPMEGPKVLPNLLRWEVGFWQMLFGDSLVNSHP